MLLPWVRTVTGGGAVGVSAAAELASAPPVASAATAAVATAAVNARRRLRVLRRGIDGDESVMGGESFPCVPSCVRPAGTATRHSPPIPDNLDQVYRSLPDRVR